MDVEYSSPHCEDLSLFSMREIQRFNLGDEQLRHIFAHVAMPIGICDGEGNFIFFNSAYASLIGYALDELYQKRFEEIVHPEDLASNRQLVEELTGGKRTSCDVVNRYVHKDGRDIWVHKYISVLRDDANRVTHMIGFVIDVSEHKQVELSLKENQQRLQAIMNSANDGIVSIDRNGTIESVNPAMVRFFGYTESELIGQNIKILMPPPYGDEGDSYVTRYLKTGEKKMIGRPCELSALRKDGTVFPIELNVAEVDRMGIFTGFIRDLSGQQQERERVIKAERLAGLGEAMAALVHENRNALSRVQANLRMLARRLKNDEKLLKLIDGALSASDDLGRQYEQVREYAAPIRLKCAPVKLKDLVEEAWDQLTAERSGRKTTLRMTFNDTDSDCLADRFQLLHAFRNILENTLTATDEETVMVDVEFFGAKLQGNPTIQVRFRDHGPGLNPEVLDNSLEAFVTTKSRGTGLGLAIVKRIVEAHGGQVAIHCVNPPEGTGTVVSVALPAETCQNCQP